MKYENTCFCRVHTVSSFAFAFVRVVYHISYRNSFYLCSGVHAEYVLFADVVWGDIDSSALFAIVEVVRFDRGLPSDAEVGPGVPGIGDDRGDFYRVLFLSQFAVF